MDINHSRGTAILLYGEFPGKYDVAKLLAYDIVEKEDAHFPEILQHASSNATLEVIKRTITQRTIVVIIHDCPDNYKYEDFFELIEHGITGCDNVYYNPVFIFTTQQKPEKREQVFYSKMMLVEAMLNIRISNFNLPF